MDIPKIVIEDYSKTAVMESAKDVGTSKDTETTKVDKSSMDTVKEVGSK